ncbi:MAG: ABC transporter permease [Gemmatimonadota bacterium]
MTVLSDAKVRRADPALEARVAEPAPPPEPPALGLFGQLPATVRDLWAHRELVYQLTLRDVRIRYKQAIMGFGWAIFMPVLIIGSGLLVRFSMAQMSGRELISTVVAGMAIKALPWAFFAGAIGFATPSLVSNANLVTKIAFPREVLPVSATLAQTFDSTIGTLVLLILLPFLGVIPTVTALWAPVIAVLLFLFTIAVGLLLSCGNLFFRDVKYIVQVILTFGIFFTPVLYEPEHLGPRGTQLIMLNPLSPLLEGLRLSVVQGHNLLVPLTAVSKTGVVFTTWDPWYLVYSAACAVGGVFIAALVFHRLESLFAERV